MNVSRKEFIGSLIAAGLVPAVGGCKNIPSAAEMYPIALTVGLAAGKVADRIKMSDRARKIIIDIGNECRYVLPEVGKTFTECWSPIADAHIKVLVDAGTITQAEGDLIKTAFLVVTKGIDLVFVRYPKAAAVKDLVIAAVNGFFDGFLEVFRPENNSVEAKGVDNRYDKEAYEYLMSLEEVRKAL